MQNPHTRAGRPAFTLVELLVVIGIIAVLVALLLPVLGKATRQSRTISGLSNQRTLLQAVQMYVAENQTYLPPGQFNIGTGDWQTVLNGYLNRGGPDWSSQSGQNKVFLDPSATIPRSSRHFSVHPVLMPMINMGNPNYQKILRVRRPSDLMLITDGTQQGSGSNRGFVQQRAWAVDGISQLRQTSAGGSTQGLTLTPEFLPRHTSVFGRAITTRRTWPS